MELKLDNLNNKEWWAERNINIPLYDINEVKDKTSANPTWLHFGAGNIFRGFIANLQQKLLNEGLTDTGIIASDTFDYEMLEKVYDAYDNLTLLVGLKADGNNNLDVIGSVTEAVKAECKDCESYDRLKEIVCSKSLQMISFTITEKGYGIYNLNGDVSDIVLNDIKNGPGNVVHAMSVVSSLLYERYKNGAYPIALVSMDNCSHNGDKLKSAVLYIVKKWNQSGLVEDDFVNYIEDGSKVSFPWSMIDKITPRPDVSIEKALIELGFENINPITTSKNTYIAPFVNAEIPQYLVIEDDFPNGRPSLEKAGVYFTDRDTVNNTEKMKVTTCLNPLHTALAIFGCLLGYNKISDEMQDNDLVKLIKYIGYKEGIPVVVDPGIISPMDFINEVLTERLPNPYLPDTTQRIATDTSQKMAIRFGETIKSYIKIGKQNELKYIPIVIAGWLRYLTGIDDNGNVFELSSDPMLSELTSIMSCIRIGHSNDYSTVYKIISNENLFGVNLVDVGMDKLIIKLLDLMITDIGAVRSTLGTYLN